MNLGSKKFAHIANKMRPPTNNNPRPSAALRDALLPKLLSGELRVPAAAGKLAEPHS